MHDPHGTFGGVHMLPARTAGSIHIDAQVRRRKVYLRPPAPATAATVVGNLAVCQHRDRRGACLNYGAIDRNTLDAMAPALPFESVVGFFSLRRQRQREETSSPQDGYEN